MNFKHLTFYRLYIVTIELLWKKTEMVRTKGGRKGKDKRGQAFDLGTDPYSLLDFSAK